MSENIESAETESQEDVKPEETLVTQDQPEEKPKGPEPIYKDDEESEGEPKEDVEKKEEKPKDDEEPEEKKPKDDEEPEEVKKSKDYDSLEKSEDSPLTDSDMERILARAKEEGLSKEDAQKYVDVAEEAVKSLTDWQGERHNELSEQWIEEVKSDKELGGEKFDESIQMANKAIKKFGTESFIESLNQTKFGNNPEVVRIFSRIGRAMSPDSLHVSEAHMKTEKTMEQLFYPEGDQA